MSDGQFWIDEEKKQLVLSDGESESRFYIEDDLVIDGTKYLIIVDSEGDKDSAATVIKIVNEGEEELIVPVEDEEEFNKVKHEYTRKG
ncbi:DUF1292 domain-containing protein [Halanaerobium sp. Z-7514]|uniref:DUF1292 domain-containing protein n=1 Tax=Halanaerobium polyolivorans TaxID=2886943 RepID=A0AAW4WYJ2_9FIRM|nr:DUF1292 domain-containing protein [Halanaerobium polyolivorans]MCC3143709.1 DUF1292 domain-containing protein [Halanaerobium polyolivorans]RQD73297.1 MAG: DUF1292 domain-containing protein [Halanaerobium sp. MSAO_Bac5]